MFFELLAKKDLKKRLTGGDSLDRLPSCRFALAEQKAGL